MQLDQLFQSVYDDPRDDARRLVLADALLERGDARGELIMLQFQTHALARKRARKLIDRHRERFLGPLSTVVLPGSDQWERGFLVSGAVRLSGSTVGCREWSTVRRLLVVGVATLDPAELASPHMRSLKEVRLHCEREHPWVRRRELEVMRARVVCVLERVHRLKVLAPELAN